MIRCVLFVLMLIPTLVFAEGSQGERLLNRLWRDLQANNVKSIEKYTSRKFQSMHFDGARNKWQEMNYIKTLNIPSYVLSDVKITKSQDAYVMTYFVTIGSNSIANGRLTVFKKIKGHWKWLAHANLSSPA